MFICLFFRKVHVALEPGIYHMFGPSSHIRFVGDSGLQQKDAREHIMHNRGVISFESAFSVRLVPFLVF